MATGILKSLSSRVRRRSKHLFLALVGAGMMIGNAQALPIFARQTGQNCVSCHAGGQFPELTPYGRLFKLTGYTMGDRADIPLAVMGVLSYAKVSNTSTSGSTPDDFQKNGLPIFATGSVFTGGKITENTGAFVQATYDNYAGNLTGHTAADNMDFRYADRFISGERDLIVGVSVNNNPSVSDPWNTAAAWMAYVPNASPGSHQFVDGLYPGLAAGANVAGVTAYAFLNTTWYGELGLYRTADEMFSFMRAGIPSDGRTALGKTNPYWRLAYSREWGANNVMVGATGMLAHIYDGGDNSTSDNLESSRNTGIDAQYQYLLDPHTVTAQLAYMRQVTNYSVNTLAGGSPYFLADGVTPVAAPNPSDTTNTLRLKLTYISQAKYGGSLAYFNVTGTTNTLNQTSGYDTNGQITATDPLGTGISSTPVGGNLSGSPATRGFVYELFWTPVQYVRVGGQYTAYNKFNGASNNYDGFGRDAKDNNTLRFYVWGAI